MVIRHVLTHGLIFAVSANAYLFLVMISTTPRVWGYTDYPKAIKNKVPAQTRGEKLKALLIGLPWLIFILGFPLFSTYSLKSKLGHEIPFWTAFLNVFVMILLVTIGDMVILDWIVVSKITPRFVVIPGSEKADYKDFSQHFRAHAKAAVGLVLVALIMAAIVSHF
ncbi:MAG: hypothetical protein ABR951_01590 [Candidatus Aminicenantales bacterium]|jgi:hypothetical protein